MEFQSALGIGQGIERSDLMKYIIFLFKKTNKNKRFKMIFSFSKTRIIPFYRFGTDFMNIFSAVLSGLGLHVFNFLQEL